MRVVRAMFPIVLMASIVLVASIVLASPLAAQTVAQRSGLEKRSQALQFEISYDFKLSPFQGATLSYERFLRDRLALRLGLGVSMDYMEGPRTVDIVHDVEASARRELTEWSHRYSLSCDFVSYRQGKVAFYYGGGPQVTYSNDLDEYFNYSASASGSSTHRDRLWRYSWGVGLEGLAGVQWLINDRFRLQAEYRTAALYGKEFYETVYKETVQTGSSTEYYKNKTTDDRYRVQVISEGTHLGLSVTF